MTPVPGSSAYYWALKGFRKSMSAALEKPLTTISGILARNTDRTGVIPPANERQVLADAGEGIQRFFVGPDLRHPFAADGVTALAPYPTLLNFWIGWTQLQVADYHARFMNQRLPDDLVRWLSQAAPPPNYGRETLVVTPTGEGFRYDPAHTWVDPRGYRLSDRIWQTSVATRTKIDLFLSDSIRSGMSSLDMSKLLEQFLLPERQALRTRKPYGTDASFDGMRLGRAEISHAHTQMTFAAADANPFADGMEWKLSGSHPKGDECDRLATLDAVGNRLRDSYPLDGAPMVGVDSHIGCLCVNFASASRSIAEVVADLRLTMDEGEEPPFTPAAPAKFAAALMGNYLVGLIAARRSAA